MPVLGEQARPSPRIGTHFIRIFVAMRKDPHPAGWHDRRHRLSALTDDPWVLAVEKNPQPEDASLACGDASISEVKAQQVRVVTRGQCVEVMRRMPTRRAAVLSRDSPPEWSSTWDLPVPPIPDRSTRDPGVAGNLAVVEAVLNQPLNLANLLDRAHEFEDRGRVGWRHERAGTNAWAPT